jgi:hypothetical protein
MANTSTRRRGAHLDRLASLPAELPGYLLRAHARLHREMNLDPLAVAEKTRLLTGLSEKRAQWLADREIGRSPTWVYLIREAGADPGIVKAGVTLDPHARLRDLQGGNPRQLEVLCAIRVSTGVMARRIEAMILTANLRLVGEWVRIEGADLPALLTTVAAKAGAQVIDSFVGSHLQS